MKDSVNSVSSPDSMAKVLKPMIRGLTLIHVKAQLQQLQDKFMK
jgi:hypothetical protein